MTYEPVKIGVLANSENVENAVKWLTKLAEELYGNNEGRRVKGAASPFLFL